MRVKVSHVRVMCVEVSFRHMSVTYSRRVCRDRMLVVVCVQDPQRNKCGVGQAVATILAGAGGGVAKMPCCAQHILCASNKSSCASCVFFVKLLKLVSSAA